MVSKAKRKPSTRALARVGDPLVTEKGTVLQPENYVKGQGGQSAKPIPSHSIDPATYKSTKQRNVKDLPASVAVTNAVSVVFMYTILGVGDREIADALHTTVDEIVALRTHSAYGECFQAVLAEFINASSDLLTSRIAAYSHTALETVGTLASEGKKEEVKLRASIDLLDRAGVRPKDQDQRQQVTKNELRIIVVDGEKGVNVNVGFNPQPDGE